MMKNTIETIQQDNANTAHFLLKKIVSQRLTCAKFWWSAFCFLYIDTVVTQ